MTFDSTGSVPWLDRMRRVDAEWFAPEDVVAQLGTHYLEAQEWMQNALITRSVRLWSMSSAFLSGVYHHRLQDFLREQQRRPRAIGVLRADHRLEARHFKPTGTECCLIDYQSERRMATYDPTTMTRVLTQDLGDGIEVYSMCYDPRDRRWKIDSFVQNLPADWNSRYQPITPKLLSSHIGNDNYDN